MAMVREGLGKLDRWIRRQPLVTPAFKKLREGRNEVVSTLSGIKGTENVVKNSWLW